MNVLQVTFINLCERYTTNKVLIESLWNEIERQYAGPNRYYHNLNHLNHLLQNLEYCKEKISDKDCMLFALYYHDYIYDVRKTDNEILSAATIGKKLSELQVPSKMIVQTEKIILATQSHEKSNNGDVNLFTDADLAILGSDRNSYKQYAANIRKEYAIYEDAIYIAGRRKVLQHFLKMKSIYKTRLFQNLYGATARINLQEEIENLD